MNITRIVLAALAAQVSYFLVGGIFFAIPAYKAEFEKFPAVYRGGKTSGSVMGLGMFGILIAIVTATTIFALMHPAGAGMSAGLTFGVLLAVYQLGSFVLHNHMMLNISGRMSALQAGTYSAEWITVGVVISLVYRGQ